MLIRESALYTAGKLLPGLLGMATTALLTRLLDPAAYGLYGLSLVVVAFGSAVLFDWLGLAYLRVAQGMPDAFGTIGTLFGGMAALTVAAVAAAWSAGLLAGPAGRAITAGLALMVCYAGFELAARLPVARFQPGRFLLMNAGRGVLSLAGAAGAAWLTRDPAWTACGTALGSAAAATLGGLGRTRPCFNAAQARAIVAFGLPLAASMAMASIASSGIRGLLDALGSTEALGFYTAAFLLVQNTLSVVAAGLASAGYPAAVRALDTGREDEARQQVADNWSLLLVVLAPMAVGMALTAPGLAALLVGPHYVAGVAALTPWLAAAGFFAAIRAHGLDHVFQLAGRPGQLASISAIAAGLAVALAFVLIPRSGPLGAAYASVAAALVSCLVALAWGRRTWRVELPLQTITRVALACVVLAVSVYAAGESLPAEIAAGAGGYVAACLALNVLSARSSLAACWPRLAPLRGRQRIT